MKLIKMLLWNYLIVYYNVIFLWVIIFYTGTVFTSFSLCKLIVYLLLIILSSTYISLVERHVVALVQQRVGPSTTGLGLLQPLADAFKLLSKEPSRPYRSYLYLFRLAPIYTLTVALLIWAFMPVGAFTLYINTDYNLIVILAIFTLNNYGIMLGAWASQNKYAMLSGYRTIALTSSYGISLTLIFWYPAILAKSYNLHNIVEAQNITCWNIWPGLPVALLFIIILLTEIKKIPFDVTESEAELGSGYLVEYSGMAFALYIISEYCYIVIFLSLFIQCFVGGWLLPEIAVTLLPELIIYVYFIKLVIALFSYLLTRSSLPNYRFDFIMSLHWRCLFPFSLATTLFSAFICT